MFCLKRRFVFVNKRITIKHCSVFQYFNQSYFTNDIKPYEAELKLIRNRSMVVTTGLLWINGPAKICDNLGKCNQV